jgi:hypothetical protein
MSGEPSASGPSPIFVIGSPRSGTSIVPWALAEHPSFWTSPESAFLPDLFPSGVVDRAFATAEAVGWAAALGVDRATFARHVGAGINDLLTSLSGGRRWIDQTPANTLIAFELADLLPQACFVHMVRDGRRVVDSMQHFSHSLGAELAAQGRLPRWAGDFRSSVTTWRDFVTTALRFEEEHAKRCVRLRLEDAVADPHGAFARLLGELGEPADARPAAYFSSRRINSSFGDQKGNADPKAVDVDADPFGGWTAEQRQVFVDEGAEELLERLGYSPSRPSSEGEPDAPAGVA